MSRVACTVSSSLHIFPVKINTINIIMTIMTTEASKSRTIVIFKSDAIHVCWFGVWLKLNEFKVLCKTIVFMQDKLTSLKFIFIICLRALNPHSPLSCSRSRTCEEDVSIYSIEELVKHYYLLPSTAVVIIIMTTLSSSKSYS